jgi:trk system potassium uptake protein TrkA
MEYVAKPDSKVTKGTLEEIGFPSDAIIGGIVRGKDTLIPDDATTVKPFDKVVVFAMPSAFNKLGKFFNSSDRFF